MLMYLHLQGSGSHHHHLEKYYNEEDECDSFVTLQDQVEISQNAQRTWWWWRWWCLCQDHVVLVDTTKFSSITFSARSGRSQPDLAG